MIRFSLIALFFLMLIIVGCSDAPVNYKYDRFDPSTYPENWFQLDPCVLEEYNVPSLELIKIEESELFFYGKEIRNPYPDSVYDKDGIIRYYHRPTGKYFYHPIKLAEEAVFALLNNFMVSGDSVYLKRAMANSNKLQELAEDFGDAKLYPYLFEFDLHDIKSERMNPPWYSAMAQGEIMSTYARLYTVTGDSTYLNEATAAFNGMLRFKNNGEPWLSCADSLGNLWLEEYPYDTPCLTLNGFMFAIIGVYDYWRVTNDARSREILQASLGTLKNRLYEFKVKREPSHYCLRHHGGVSRYHRIHITQLEYFYRITGDEFFKNACNDFYADHMVEVAFKMPIVN